MQDMRRTLLDVERPEIIHERALGLAAKDEELGLVHANGVAVPTNGTICNGQLDPFLRSLPVSPTRVVDRMLPTQVQNIQSLILGIVLLDFGVASPDKHDPISNSTRMSYAGHRRVALSLDRHGGAVPHVHRPHVVADRLVHQTAKD